MTISYNTVRNCIDAIMRDVRDYFFFTQQDMPVDVWAEPGEGWVSVPEYDSNFAIPVNLKIGTEIYKLTFPAHLLVDKDKRYSFVAFTLRTNLG